MFFEMRSCINFYYFFVILLSFFKNNDSANIFCIFPTASYSHQQPMLALSHALAKKGHNLTVITPNPSKFPIKNHRDIDISFMYDEWKKLQSSTESKFFLQKPRSPYSLMKDYPNLIDFITTLIFESPQIQDLIKELRESNTKYDLVIYEPFGASSFMGFVEILNRPPLIGLFTIHSTVSVDLEMGNPVLPSSQPGILTGYEHKMTFWERFNNLCLALYIAYIKRVVNISRQEEVMKRYFGNLENTANEMEHNKSLLIISCDYTTSYSKPVNPNTIYVGPMHIKNPEPLPQDIKEWMDESDDGVIYFSLGTNVKGTSLLDEKRMAFIRAFSNFPKMRVLWKWESDAKLPGQPSNVLVKNWFPQDSVLAHPKMKLFISQVGLQSFQEAIRYGVPVLGIPIFGDQYFNARKLVQTRAGLSLDFYDITYENLFEKLNELLSNTSYKENMILLSAISRDKPMSAVDSAVWWVEYVLRHNGAPHLRSVASDLHWYQAYMLDIILFVIRSCINFYYFFVILLSFFKNNDSANIFCIFPLPSYSHQQPMLALSHALAKKGHNLTVITPNPSKFPIKNHRDIDISFMYDEWKKLQSSAESKFFLQEPRSPYSLMKDYPNLIDFITTLIFESPQIQDLIKELRESNTKYDLVIYEPLGASSFMGFVEILNRPPLIGLFTIHSTVSVDLEMGNPVLPSSQPGLLTGYEHKMTFWERFNNLCLALYIAYLRRVVNISRQEEVMKRYFGNLENTANEMEHNKSLLIISCDYTTSYSKPVNPNTIYVGPMHIKDPEPLPQDIKEWMDESDDGVIYFSLGTNVKGTSLPDEKRMAFIRAFSNFPKMRVLWKWESDAKLPGQPSNVLVKNWFPQDSVLAHPKMKLFISQVGLQSFQEAIRYGVPVLGIPIFGDQYFNARKLVQTRAGLSLDFYDITYENLFEKFNKLLSNTSYKENMILLSAISRDKPMSAVDSAVWWVEYVLRHNGAPHLRSVASDLHWYQAYMLDIILFVIVSLSFSMLLIIHCYCRLKKMIYIFSERKIKTN